LRHQDDARPNVGQLHTFELRILQNPAKTGGRRLFGRRTRKEELRQADFNAYVVSEPACSFEIVKDVGRDGKILGKWILKLQMPSQEIVLAQGQVGLRHGRRSGR
jgi:hypothetical protein